MRCPRLVFSIRLDAVDELRAAVLQRNRIAVVLIQLRYSDQCEEAGQMDNGEQVGGSTVKWTVSTKRG